MAANNKVQVYLTDELYALLQDFKKDSGIPKNSEAVKVLLRKILIPETHPTDANKVSPELESMSREHEDMRMRLNAIEQFLRDREQANIQPQNKNGHEQNNYQKGPIPITQTKARLATDDDEELRGAFLLS